MDIEELRERIAEIDRKIMELAAERTRIAGEIGSIKRTNSLPIRVPDVEDRVISCYRSFAESNDIDPNLMETVVKALIDMSVIRQTEG